MVWVCVARRGVFYNTRSFADGEKRMNFKVILFGLISCLAVIFIIQNVAAVTVNIFLAAFSSIAADFHHLAAGFAAG